MALRRPRLLWFNAALTLGLAGVEFGDHQRFTIKRAVMICLLMLAASLVLGIFPHVGG